ncbi:HEAT repeat domain-containing protein [Actinoplanes solisilvae]|uniref:HEAT repeat domain-containing protein n=1 Tax=Actinoplanes solisilvae TaxID=2486853 RepID=UPI000FDC7B1F|nr:HEAT repeat domain-containing protein [Actinoplanes solisilvae]
MFETLHDVPWSDIDHAYGPADDVPAALRALLSDDADVRKKTLWTLYGNIFHQGTRYEASSYAVPFLLELVADPSTPDRPALIELLVALAIGYDESYLPDGFPIGELRAGAAGGAELLRDGGGGFERFESLDEQDQSRLQARIELNVYEAVAAGTPTLVRLLGDAAPEVRRQAAYALGWFPESAPLSLPALRAATADPDPTVAATALIALGLLDDARAMMLALLTGDSPEIVRAAAAVALARRHVSTPAVVSELLRATSSELPFLGADLAGLAALSLRRVLADDSEQAIDMLLGRLATGSLAIAQELVRRAFPDGPVPSGTPFDDLTAGQKRVVHALADTPSVWRLGNFFWVVGAHGLPNSAEKMRAYAGTVNTP